MEKTDKDVRFFFLEDCGEAPSVLCAKCTLEPRNRAGAHSLVQAHSFHYHGVQTRLQLPKWNKQVIYLRFFFLEDCGVAPSVLCAKCSLEPRNRAGVHSLVQARSFLYYSAWTRLQLPALICLRECAIIN